MKVKLDSGSDSVFVEVTYTEGMAHISNDHALWHALEKYGAYNIAEVVKRKYQDIYGKSLNIGTTSMALEIIGHVVPDQVCRIISNSLIMPPGIKNTVSKITQHTTVIDSGESSLDTNRWFWDSLAGLVVRINCL